MIRAQTKAQSYYTKVGLSKDKNGISEIIVRIYSFPKHRAILNIPPFWDIATKSEFKIALVLKSMRKLN